MSRRLTIVALAVLLAVVWGGSVERARAGTRHTVSTTTPDASAKKTGKKKRKKRAKKAKKKRRLGRDDFYLYEYRIRRGDTVGKIAHRYGVSQEKLLSWNDLVSPHLIRAGKTLTIYSKKRLPQYERSSYTVKSGDTLGKIARRFKMRVRDLKSVNGLRRDLIRAGQRLVVLKPRSPDIARLGSGHRKGKLRDAIQLTSGAGFYVKDPHESWGTPSTIRQIKRAFKAIHRKYKRSLLCVGDVSAKYGGPLAGHRSHQRGLDVDIGYYRKGVARDKRFHRTTPKTLDARRSWALIDQFLKQGQVDMIFIDYGLQKPLYEEALRRGKSRRVLHEIFQYPRSSHARRGTIRHEPGHANHMHIRFLEMASRASRRGHRAGASK